ncbi:MAG: hypothetical protein MPK62_06690 [Alphaproteobacteria bacterium]|nr:hypothetical protein [Alphaproteobacteria bacterium]
MTSIAVLAIFAPEFVPEPKRQESKMAAKKNNRLNRLNGSVEKLAKAFGEVIVEATHHAAEQTREVVRNDIRVELGKVEKRLSDRIDTTNANMQAQFAEQEEKIVEVAKLVKAEKVESAKSPKPRTRARR